MKKTYSAQTCFHQPNVLKQQHDHDVQHVSGLIEDHKSKLRLRPFRKRNQANEDLMH